MRAYLDWELSLVAQNARDTSSLIQVLKPPRSSAPLSIDAHAGHERTFA